MSALCQGQCPYCPAHFATALEANEHVADSQDHWVKQLRMAEMVREICGLYVEGAHHQELGIEVGAIVDRYLDVNGSPEPV